MADVLYVIFDTAIKRLHFTFCVVSYVNIYMHDISLIFIKAGFAFARLCPKLLLNINMARPTLELMLGLPPIYSQIHTYSTRHLTFYNAWHLYSRPLPPVYRTSVPISSQFRSIKHAACLTESSGSFIHVFFFM